MLIQMFIFLIFLLIRIQKRPQPSSNSRQQPKNDDITIDASRVSFSIRSQPLYVHLFSACSK